MRPVDDVVIESPWTLTPEFLDTHDVRYVYHVTGKHVTDDHKEERFGKIEVLNEGRFVSLNERPDDHLGIQSIISKVAPNIEQLKSQFAVKQDKSDQHNLNSR